MDALFEAFGLDIKLLIAQAVNFGVLMIALYFFLYKPVLKVLDERRAKVAQGVEDAEAAAKTLETADAEASARMKAADAEAEAALVSARSAANDEKTRIVKDAEARAAAVEADAAARAKEAAAKALRDSEKEIARLAVLAAEKVIRDK